MSYVKMRYCRCLRISKRKEGVKQGCIRCVRPLEYHVVYMFTQEATQLRTHQPSLKWSMQKSVKPDMGSAYTPEGKEEKTRSWRSEVRQADARELYEYEPPMRNEIDNPSANLQVKDHEATA